MAIYNGNQLIIPSGISEAYAGDQLVYKKHTPFRITANGEMQIYIEEELTLLDPDYSGIIYRPDFYYSINGGQWQQYTIGDYISLSNQNDYVEFENHNAVLNHRKYYKDEWGSFVTDYTISFSFKEITNSTYNISGELVSLINYANEKGNYKDYLPIEEMDSSSGLFCGLFMQSNKVYDASELILPNDFEPFDPDFRFGLFQRLFYACRHMVTGPIIPAATPGITGGVYLETFRYCQSLESIRLNYTGAFNANNFQNWVSGVPQSGDFYYNGTDTTRGDSAIPTGWTVHNF